MKRFAILTFFLCLSQTTRADSSFSKNNLLKNSVKKCCVKNQCDDFEADLFLPEFTVIQVSQLEKLQTFDLNKTIFPIKHYTILYIRGPPLLV